MRPKIRRPVKRRAPRAHEPDAAGQTIDWIGVQAVGSGGGPLPWWLVGVLSAARAAPFVAWRVARRAALRRGRAGPPGPE